MTSLKSKDAVFFFFIVSFFVSFRGARSHIVEFDEYWTRRAEEAKKETINAYHPNPIEVIEHFNWNVHRSYEEMFNNSTRRSLKGNAHSKGGPCLVTNPIDRCWRCDPSWAQNRKRLADCVLGFGRETRGGKFGKYYVVTDSSDNDMANPKPGTLRHAVTRNGPLWIYFAHSMVIRLNQELIMTSNKTIDARGANIQIINGAGLMMQFVKNIIIHGLHIRNIVQGNGGMIMNSEDHVGARTASDGDGISIFGSSNIWVDHVSMSACGDGLIDVIEGSTAITISNCHFTHHNDVMLFGASGMSTQDKKMQVTVAFNHFGKGLIQRMPRVRFGFIHVVNNDYTHWLSYAIGGSNQPTIISQGNRYIAPPNPNAKQVTKREYEPESVWKNWLWKSEGDLLMNNAYFVTSGNPNQQLHYSYKDMIKSKPGTAVRRLTRFSGSIACSVGKPC